METDLFAKEYKDKVVMEGGDGEPEEKKQQRRGKREEGRRDEGATEGGGGKGSKEGICKHGKGTSRERRKT